MFFSILTIFILRIITYSHNIYGNDKTESLLLTNKTNNYNIVLILSFVINT
jgi:hypothetical protein